MRRFVMADSLATAPGTLARTLRVGLLGCGIVGEGTLRLLRDNEANLSRRLGASIEVRRVVARDRDKPRSDAVPEGLLSFDANDVLDDPEIDVVVELMGGLDPAFAYVRTALERGKSVITANKFLLAEHGHELFELAESRGADLYFEAAVCGGVPVIRVLREALASDTVVSLRGIVNGTSNYILSRMAEEKIDYEVALRGAQAAGYAEADPSLDVNGGDAVHKLTILSTLAFGAKIRIEQISREGIEDVAAIDMRFAERFGYVIKLLATGRALPSGALDLRVHPALVRRNSVLASISGALNAVVLEGERLGPCMLSGYGAGAMPTAMSVVSDLVDVGRNAMVGSRGRVPHRAVRSEFLAVREVQDPGAHVGAYYLRFSVLDRPDILARVTGVLGAFDVSIEQLVQDGRAPGASDPVQLVMLTHATKDANVRGALREIDRLSGIARPTRAIRIEEA
jgi:homoserine dehydrogenase